MFRSLFFLLFFLPACNDLIAGEHSLARAESIITTEAAPSSFVNGTVNAIDGSFTFRNLDLVVPGKEAMNVIHYYSSKSRYSSWLGTGMSLNYGFWIVGKTFADKKKDTHGKYSHLNAEAAGGSVICCLAKTKFEGNTHYLDPEIIYRGLTNCGAGEISARTNLKNTYIEEKVSKDGSCADLTSYFSDGTIKEYHRSYDKESVVNAQCERKPNLSRLDYTYHSDYSPKRITAKGYRTLNWLDFNKKHRERTITSSNGKTVTYKSFEKSGASYIYEVESSDSPTQRFHYTNVHGHQQIDRISWPDDRFLEVEYDSKARVISQKAPIGEDGEKRTLYSLSYHPDDHYTKVTDALGRKSIYRYEYGRLTALEQYKKNNTLCRSTAFYWGKRTGLSWGKHPKTDEGNLLAEALLDGDKKAHQARSFSYDEYGNVVKESLYGNLTGSGKKSFSLSSEGTPSSSDVEHYSKRYTYSKDRFHVKLSETENDGPTIKYRYKKNSNIPIAKYICDGDAIRIREFYSYDTDGVLIQKIVDDGTALSRKDLSGATQRLSTKIDPVRNKEGFGQGLAQKITELYYDFHNKREVLLRRTEYVYNKQGNVSKEKVFDASNNHCYTIHLQYDEKGRLHRRKNELGQWFVYDYDKNSNKIFERQLSSGFHTSYTYDKANRLTAVTEHHEDKTVIGTKYSYDLMGNKTSTTDRYGNKTLFEYDSCHRLKKIILPELDNGHRYTICKKWDIFNNLQSQMDQNGCTTTYEYTARKQPTLVTFADNSKEKYEYNLNGTLKNTWDRSDTKTSYSYDIFGRVTKVGVYDPFGSKVAETTNHYNAFHLLSTTDPMGYTTNYCYDQAGRKIEEWIKDGDNYRKKTFEYDSLGRVSCTKAYYGTEIKDFIATYTEYDLLDRLTVEKDVDVTGACINWTCFEYDARGNCIKKRHGITDTQEGVIHSPHNSQSEIIKHIDEQGHSTHFFIDHGFKNFFNQQVPRNITTDPLGTSTEEYHDALGRIVSVLKKNAQGALLAATDFAYNGTGQKVKQVEHMIVNGQVERDYTITWERDALDRAIKQIEQPGTPHEKITQYEYDNSGRLLQLIKPDGIILYHAYDALGRLLHLSSSDGSVSYSYTYDLHNNPIEVHDEVHNLGTKRTYDAWNSLLSDGVNTHCTHFTYDAIGRLTTLTAPDSSSISYMYDTAHLRSIRRGAYEHTYDTFDLRENVLQSTAIDSSTICFEWDKKGRNTKISSRYFTQEIPADGFDPVGNLRAFFTRDPVGEIHSRASYDDLYQLTEESGVQSHTYTNDSISNRIGKNDQAYSIDDTNKLVSDSVEQYVYDRNGNMIEKRSDTRAIYYSYDALDRLIKVVDGSDTTLYTYDYLHRRIARSKNGNTPEYFLYFGCREVGLYDPATQAIKEYRVLGLGKGAELGASIAIELDGKTYCPIHDHRGNIVCLVDPDTGVLEESYRYTAFGECETYDNQQLPTTSSQLNNPWGYSSKRLDQETGFVYFHRRYYSPPVGRWVTPDPLGFADGPNMYAYVHNNPLTSFDLYGLIEEREATAKADTQDKSEGGWFSRIGQGIKDFGGRLFDHGVGTIRGTVDMVSSGMELSKNFVTSPVDTTQAIGGTIGSSIAETCGYLMSPGRIIDDARSYVDGNSFGEICADAVVFIGPSKIVKGLSSATKAASLIGSEAKAVGAAAKGSATTPHTKSSLQRGQAMHKEYMLDQVKEEPFRFLKERRLPSGKRPDVLDTKNHIIYELKPNNPRAIRDGHKQLEMYKNDIKQDPIFKDYDWKTRLDTY